jgi:hypothetical protein
MLFGEPLGVKFQRFFHDLQFRNPLPDIGELGVDLA